MNIRTFIALELSDEAKQELSRVTGLLKKVDADVKWATPEAIHITLKFLGNIPEKKTTFVIESLKLVVSQIPSFDITLGGIGVFPGWSAPRILWIDINEGHESLEKLAGSIRSVMFKAGFGEDERQFSPHITVGRIKSGRNKAVLRKEAGLIEVVPILIPISRVTFFKSILTKEGARHTVLSAWDLTG